MLFFSLDCSRKLILDSFFSSKINEDVGWCKLTTPNGLQQLIQISHPGVYERYKQLKQFKYKMILCKSSYMKKQYLLTMYWWTKHVMITAPSYFWQRFKTCVTQGHCMLWFHYKLRQCPFRKITRAATWHLLQGIRKKKPKAFLLYRADI